MQPLHELILLLVVLTDFWVLGATRLTSTIRAAALQGALLATLPLALYAPVSAHMVVLALGTLVIKAFALPFFLTRAIREAAVRREVEPVTGHTTSLVLGAAAVALAFAIAPRLERVGVHGAMLIPVALSTVVIGLVVVVTRNIALNQVVGYLVLENGIFVFGLSQAQRVPFLVELGVLLDVFAGVFVMGIVVYHINREFDSLDADRLSELRD